MLVLESGWSREWSIALAAAQHIPVLVASPIDDDLARVVTSLASQEAEGAMVVPGTSLRATPVALRLRELVATRLGPVQELRIELPPACLNDSQIISVIDWCRWLLGSTVSQIERPTASGGPLIIMNCGRQLPNSTSIRTEISCPPAAESVEMHVRCQEGEAHLSGNSMIRWRTAQDSAEESLDADRPAEQVLLDLFLRRVVGGVVPVPSWADLLAACQLWMSVR